MVLDPNEAARRVFIAYRQLSEIMKEVNYATAAASLTSYNRILDTLNECFQIDSAFKHAVGHLRYLGQGDENKLPFQMKSDGRVLLATAQSFIEDVVELERIATTPPRHCRCSM